MLDLLVLLVVVWIWMLKLLVLVGWISMLDGIVRSRKGSRNNRDTLVFCAQGTALWRPRMGVPPPAQPPPLCSLRAGTPGARCEI